MAFHIHRWGTCEIGRPTVYTWFITVYWSWHFTSLGEVWKSVSLSITSPLHSFTPYTITVLNISSTYTEDQVRQCYKFCSTINHYLENPKGEGKSIVFTISLLFPWFFLSDVPRFFHLQFLLFKELPSAIFRASLLATNSFIFLILKMSWFSLHLWRIFFTEHRILVWQLEKYYATSLCFHGFWWEVSVFWNAFSPIYRKTLCLVAFKSLYFYLVFRSLTMMCLDNDFFGVFCLFVWGLLSFLNL